MEIKTVDSSEILIAGYKADTGKGFFVIPRLWKRIHKVKHKINNRIDKDFLIGLNDYRDSDFESFAPTFTYYAGTQISDVSELNPKLKLEVLEIPASSYVVFTYYGRSEDSIQSVMDYIYKQWFPQSDCQFNEEVKMDFVRYGELPNEKGLNRIEVWIPINQVI